MSDSFIKINTLSVSKNLAKFLDTDKVLILINESLIVFYKFRKCCI